jgi:hypothetical protein
MESEGRLASCYGIVMHERVAKGTFRCRAWALALGDDRREYARDNMRSNFGRGGPDAPTPVWVSWVETAGPRRDALSPVCPILDKDLPGAALPRAASGFGERELTLSFRSSR